MYSNPFRFPISSLGSPNIPSQEGWEGALAKYTANAWTSTRQILKLYNHFFSIIYFVTKAIYSFLHLAFNILHQPPIRSPTRAYITIIIVVRCDWFPAQASSRYTIRSMRYTKQKSTDCDNVRSCQSAKYAPVELVYSLDIFGCQWHARQANQRGSETTRSNQGLLWERNQGDYQSCRARPGLIWHGLLPSVHAAQFQVKDVDSTIGCTKGQWSIAV